MRLADFILANIEPLLVEWVAFARGLAPGANMTVLSLRDHAELILRFTALDMRKSQTHKQQANESGDLCPDEECDGLEHASALHGAGRVDSGFHVREVVAEYRALRASVLSRWAESLLEPDLCDVDDIKRFNELMDQSLASAVDSYSKRVDTSRQMFLAILGHDLRNPLSCIRMAARVISHTTEGSDPAKALSMIENNAETIRRLISDLVDYCSSGLGRTMPLNREMVDLTAFCRDLIDTFRTTTGRTLRFHSAGVIMGMWDPGRISQVVSNLLGNALQHGSPEGAIDVSLALEGSAEDGVIPDDSAAVLSVRNDGAPIPPEALPTIFDPLLRHAAQGSSAQRRPGSIGLGLYIVREIVTAKGGTVQVASTARDGTTFTVRIPRFPTVEGEKRDVSQAVG